jgi:hypothetical protein
MEVKDRMPDEGANYQDKETKDTIIDYRIGYIAGNLDREQGNHVYYALLIEKYYAGLKPHQVLREIKQLAISRGVTQEHLDGLEAEVSQRFTDPEFLAKQIIRRREAARGNFQIVEEVTPN